MSHALIKLSTFLFSYALTIVAIAQSLSPIEYFPHETGDHWEYRDAGDLRLEQVLTIEKDSIDQEGNIYIKYLQEPYYSVRIDTANNIYEWSGLFNEDRGLRYKLDASVGQRWIVRHEPFALATTWAEVKSITNGNVFNTDSVSIMNIEYWWVTVENDSFWLENRYLAAGFGLIERFAEPGTRIFAAGVIIDSLHYGWLTGIDTKSFRPKNFTLEQNFPNPFNPRTIIRYYLPSYSMVRLDIFNSIGQNIQTLLNKSQSPGFHVVWFDGSNLASGTYFYRLSVKGRGITKKMILLQ